MRIFKDASFEFLQMRRPAYVVSALLLVVGLLLGFALTVVGADVASMYLGDRAPRVRVFLHNAALAFAFVYPVILYGLRSRRVQRYLDRLVQRRAQAEQDEMGDYLRGVEGASGLFWRFERVLSELDLDEEGEEAFRKLVAASRSGDVKAIDIGHYRAYVEVLKDRCRARGDV